MIEKEYRAGNPSKRLSAQEKQEALFYWHLYNGNGSKVARQLNTTPKTILALAERENFEGKKALVQNRISQVLAKTDDPVLQRLVETDIRILQVAEMMLDDVYKAYKRKRLKVKNAAEAISILKYITELRERILGKNDGSGGHVPGAINVERLNVLNFNELPPSQRQNVLKILSERAGTGERVVDGDRTSLPIS